jgi:hypothetical protein
MQVLMALATVTDRAAPSVMHSTSFHFVAHIRLRLAAYPIWHQHLVYLRLRIYRRERCPTNSLRSVAPPMITFSRSNRWALAREPGRRTSSQLGSNGLPTHCHAEFVTFLFRLSIPSFRMVVLRAAGAGRPLQSIVEGRAEQVAISS